VALTPVELSVLSALVEHPGRVLSRDEILDKAYSEATEVFDRAVDVQISRLRRKLSACSPEPAIRTHRHAGYQFIARVD
jgi:two-component system, OmpR family, response regulator